MRLTKYTLLLAAASAVLTSCGDDELEIPSSYETKYFQTNASAELELSDQLDDLSDAMKMADGGNVVELASLEAEWNGTTLNSKTSALYKSIVSTNLEQLASASNYQFDLATAPDNGGFLTSNLLNAYGVEPEQVVEKGLYNAALYNEAYNIVQAVPNASEVDGLLALFGVSPSFKMSDAADVDKDIHMAKYAARMTPSSGGLYLDIKENLITAKAAAESGDFDTERDQALDAFLLNWEKTSAAIVSKYLKDSISKIAQGGDESISDGFHAYSEALGFMWGMRSLDQSKRYANNTQLDQILEAMSADFNSTVSPIDFVNDPNKLSGLNDAVNLIQSTYGFSNSEMTTFETNWVKQEGRN